MGEKGVVVIVIKKEQTFSKRMIDIDQNSVENEEISSGTLDVKVVVSNSSNFICASTDYAPDSTVCSKWAA